MRREARLGSPSCVCTCTRDFQADESDGNSILCLLWSHAGEKLIQAQAGCCSSVPAALLQFGVQVLLTGFPPLWGGVGRVGVGDCL